MDDFESFYSKLSMRFQQRVEIVDNEYKQIKKDILKKIYPWFLIAIIIVVYCAYTSKEYEILFINIFVVIVGLILYFALIYFKTSKSETFNSELPMEMFRYILSQYPYKLEYDENSGLDKETYDYLFNDYYSWYHSSEHINGELNDKNKFVMYYVETTRSDNDGGTINCFSGYVLDIDLSKSTNLKVSINNKKHKYLDEEVESDSNEQLFEKIKSILGSYKDKHSFRPECVIEDNKLYIRISSMRCGFRNSIDLLNKSSLEAIYNCLKNILELSENLVKELD